MLTKLIVATVLALFWMLLGPLPAPPDTEAETRERLNARLDQYAREVKGQ